MDSLRVATFVLGQFLVGLGLILPGNAAETDLLGDPLPEEAVARVGTTRAEDQIPADFQRPFSLRGTALSADGKVLATYGAPSDGRANQPIRIWNAETGKFLRELDGHDQPIKALAISPDGKTLVSTSSSDAQAGAGLTRIWDVASGRSLQVIEEGGTFLRFSPEGATFQLVVRNQLRAYQTQTGQEVRRFPLEPNSPKDISADGRFVLGVSHERDTVLRLYDINTKRELLELPGPNPPKVAKFSPDGRMIAVLDGGKEVQVWDVMSGRMVHELQGHASRVYALAFSADSRFLATGSLDKTVRLWELATGKEVHQHAGHTKPVTVLEFSDRSQRLVTGSMDRTALLWNTGNSLVSRLRLPEFNEDNLNTLWTDLSAVDPSPAYRAMGIVAEAEDKTLPYFQRRMEGLLIPAKNDQIQQHLKNLQHRDFRVRRDAMRALRSFRYTARGLLVKAANQTQSAEVRARLRYLLSNSTSGSRFSPGDKLRMRRLIQLAETLGTPAARNLLELLAAECPLPEIVKESQRVLAKW